MYIYFNYYELLHYCQSFGNWREIFIPLYNDNDYDTN